MNPLTLESIKKLTPDYINHLSRDSFNSYFPNLRENSRPWNRTIEQGQDEALEAVISSIDLVNKMDLIVVIMFEYKLVETWPIN